MNSVSNRVTITVVIKNQCVFTYRKCLKLIAKMGNPLASSIYL